PGAERAQRPRWTASVAGAVGRVRALLQATRLGCAAGAIFYLHVFFRHVCGGAGTVRGAPAHLARQTVWSGTVRLRVGLRRIPGNLSARAGPGAAGQTLRRA